jgi:plastocyanin
MRASLVYTAIVLTFTMACGSSTTGNNGGGGGGGGGGCGTNVPAGTVAATTNLSFVPREITISANQSVNFQFCGTNHTVAFDDANPNRPADIPSTRNATVSRTFTAPGEYEYTCTIHASMNGKVIVQ